MSIGRKEYPNGISPRPPVQSTGIQKIKVGDGKSTAVKSFRWVNYYGMYNEEDISVKILGDKEAVIHYTKNEMNNSEHRRYVMIGFIDRLKGITLEQKIEKEHTKLLAYIRSYNADVIARKEKSEALTERLRGE